IEPGNLQGTETEFGIAFDLMSFSKHRLNNLTEGVAKQLAENNRLNLQLTLSGSIRNLLWDINIATAEYSQAQSKISWLTDIRDFQKNLLKNGGGSKLALLRVELELTKAEQAKAVANMHRNAAFEQYTKLTKLSVLPESIQETVAVQPEISADHPLLQKISLARQLSKLALRTQSSAQDDWNVTLFQREVDLIGQTDTQMGVSVELPLSFSDSYTPSASQSWRTEDRDFQQQYFTTKLNLDKQLTELKEQAAYLQQMQSLLIKQLNMSRALETDLNELKSAGSINLDEYYRRLIELKDIQFQTETNELMLQRNIALQNQILGQPL
ncbi:MAG: TolC family protein, partial [Gammaproteobacteria bacterium]|nr:TolC family protein [Gammaproteobacteria bacterium]NNJ71824.1 TolC family protein [Enterobacterales bacterium]